jgi:hypothetical protein
MEIKTYFAQDNKGNILPRAHVYLYERGTTNFVYGIKDENGDGLTNPFQADQNGKILIAAPDGKYDLRVSFGGLDYTMPVQFLDSTEAVSVAVSAADRAEAARDAAQLSSGVYDDTASGLAATGPGDYFSVPSALTDESLILYRHESDDSASEITTYPSANAVRDKLIGSGVEQDDLVDVVAETERLPSGLTLNDKILAALFSDEDGYSPLMLSALGEIIIPLLRVGNLNLSESSLESGEYNYACAIVDESGNVGWGVNADGGAMLAANIQTEDSALAARDQYNISKSNQLKQSINTTAARNEFHYNHLVVYGQSLSTGQEGWPSLSKVARFGNLMLGGSVRPVDTDGSDFIPFDGDVLRPLAATVQSGSTLLSDQQVSDLSAGNQALGETVCEGMTNFAKKLHNRALQISNDPNRLFVTTNNGVSGKTIEQLSKVNTQNSTNRYGRYLDALTRIKAIADSQGESYGVTGIVWMQGEYNYRDFGGSWDKESYKTLLTQLRLDMLSDAKAVTGQEDNPAFFTYQTGAGYTRDEDSAGNPGLHVGMAQWEFSQENTDSYLVGPVYPYTDKGGHMDSNGYRWYGQQLGKVYHKVVNQGQDWRPLSPIRTNLIGQAVYIDFHVPEPPLVFDLPYVIGSATDYEDKGFKVTDDNGQVGITSVEIIGETIVKLSLARAMIGSGHVWYADKTVHNGNGNLRDSDDTVALDNYEYLPGSGMYDSANIGALVDKPYPLHNWCIAFYLPVTWEL